jgi:hypothetical protein
MKPASQRRIVGAVLRVPIGEGIQCLALTLPEADFAFFGPAALVDDASANLFSHPVLFRVAVHKSAWSTGRWSRVARVEVPQDLLAPLPKFIQDPLNASKFELYVGGEIRPAIRAECEGLERAAVWEPEHVEQRLRDHLAGVPNVWVEQLSIQNDA